MKILPKLTLSLALAFGLSAGSAYADSFSFSYLFGDGLSVTGVFGGVANGSFVENVTGVAVSFNGTEMPGSVFTSHFDGASYLSGPVISFDALQNNFIFANSDLANGDFGFDSVFYMLNASVYSDTAVAFSALGYASQDRSKSYLGIARPGDGRARLAAPQAIALRRLLIQEPPVRFAFRAPELPGAFSFC
jgi:hypothetical protein